MNDLEDVQVRYNQLSNLVCKLYKSLRDGEEISTLVMHIFPKTRLYTNTSDLRTLMINDDYIISSTNLSEFTKSMVYITFDYCMYKGIKYYHFNYNIDDFFSLSTIYDLDVLKVLYISIHLHEHLFANIEQTVSVNISVLEDCLDLLH